MTLMATTTCLHFHLLSWFTNPDTHYSFTNKILVALQLCSWLSTIHVIAEICPRVCWTLILNDIAWHRAGTSPQIPFSVDPHGGIPTLGPLPYHQNIFSGLDLMILLCRKRHTGEGFPGGSAVSLPAMQELPFDPSQEVPMNGYPLHYSSLENPHGQRNWRLQSGVTELDTTDGRILQTQKEVLYIGLKNASVLEKNVLTFRWKIKVCMKY